MGGGTLPTKRPLVAHGGQGPVVGMTHVLAPSVDAFRFRAQGGQGPESGMMHPFWFVERAGADGLFCVAQGGQGPESGMMQPG